jgi:3-methyladenine DNA glycosylase/8-oxoguanine DNA glycosylase
MLVMVDKAKSVIAISEPWKRYGSVIVLHQRSAARGYGKGERLREARLKGLHPLLKAEVLW